MGFFEIDRFAVKPSGLLAKWRYKRVLIDENGNLTTDNVDDLEPMNLPCIGDYKKNDRAYAANALITQFCNYDTHTYFRVYAQDCNPFAYVQADLRQAKCGYQAPLPKPVVPPTPFPAPPTYGLFARLDICDDKNIPVNIKIFKRNYVGAVTQIKNGGASPAILSYKNTTDYKLTPIRFCEFQLTLVSASNFNLEQLYTQDAREFKVEVTKGGKIKFIGFGTAEEASEEFTNSPYDVTWRATDGLKGLENIKYPLPLGTRTDIRQKFIDILIYCLSKTDLNINIATVCNLYESKMVTGLNDDPLGQCTVNPLRFTKKGEIFDCYKVLEAVCLEFGAFIVQDNGIWNFVRQSELSFTVLRRRLYNSTGLFLKGEQFKNKRIATCKGSDISMLDDKPILRISDAYKRAEVSIEYNEVPLILYNGDFELWDGTNFTGWTKYGGIQLSRVENSILTSAGSIPNGNYSVQFNQVATSSKYFEAGPVLVNQDDELNLSFNVGATKDLASFKLRIKVGLYYLTNVSGGDKYTWVQQLATCSIPVNNTSGNINNYTIEIAIPAIPISFEMYVQLFGFATKPGKTYIPSQIDNIKFTKSTANSNSGKSLYLVEQPAFYTKKSDEVKLLFGDYTGQVEIDFSGGDFDANGVRLPRTNGDGTGGSRPSRSTETNGLKNDYYSIKTKDGSYSTGWYEFGSDSISPIPIGLMLARNILKAYQKPFRFLENSFFGPDISYLDVFNINLPNDLNFSAKIFALQSGDFNLISGELNNAVYVEIFEKNIAAVKLTLSGKILMSTPGIDQNQNGIKLFPETGGIFTNEFTQEFR